MKAIWDNMFFDIDECNDSREDAVNRISKTIRDDLDEIKFAIQDLKPLEAIEKIKQMQKDY